MNENEVRLKFEVEKVNFRSWSELWRHRSRRCTAFGGGRALANQAPPNWCVIQKGHVRLVPWLTCVCSFSTLLGYDWLARSYLQVLFAFATRTAFALLFPIIAGKKPDDCVLIHLFRHRTVEYFHDFWVRESQQIVKTLRSKSCCLIEQTWKDTNHRYTRWLISRFVPLWGGCSAHTLADNLRSRRSDWSGRRRRSSNKTQRVLQSRTTLLGLVPDVSPLYTFLGCPSVSSCFTDLQPLDCVCDTHETSTRSNVIRCLHAFCYLYNSTHFFYSCHIVFTFIHWKSNHGV